MKPIEEPINVAHARRLSLVNQKHDKKADMKKMTEYANSTKSKANKEETKSDEANNSFEELQKEAKVLSFEQENLAHTFEGELMKKGKRTSIMVTRYYVISNHTMYIHGSKSDF